MDDEGGDIPFEGDDDLTRGRARRALDREVEGQVGRGYVAAEAHLDLFLYLGYANLDVDDSDLADNARRFVTDLNDLHDAEARRKKREETRARRQLERYGDIPLGDRYAFAARVRIGEGRTAHIADREGNWQTFTTPGDLLCGASGFARTADDGMPLCRACVAVARTRTIDYGI